MEFKEYLKTYMALQGIQNTELAPELGVCPMTISRWRTGANMPYKDKYDTICKVLHLQKDKLLKMLEEQGVTAPTAAKNNEFSEFLRKKINEYSMTYKTAANRIGVSANCIGRWVCADSVPSISYVPRVSKLVDEHPLKVAHLCIIASANDTAGTAFGKLLRQVRYACGIKFEDIDTLFSISGRTWTNWETYEVTPTEAHVKRLACITGLSEEIILSLCYAHASAEVSNRVRHKAYDGVLAYVRSLGGD